jgi:hypothetical protein
MCKSQQPHLKLGLAKLADGSIEQLSNMLSSRQISLSERSVSLLIGCGYAKPSQIEADSTSNQ